MKVNKDEWLLLNNIKMCNGPVIIRIVLFSNKSWQTNEASQMSRNRYVYIHMCESGLKAASEISGEWVDYPHYSQP